MKIKKVIKKFLNKIAPNLTRHLILLLRKIKKTHFNLTNQYFHFNLSKKTKGASIVSNEKGFIISFIKNNFLTFHLRPKSSKNFENISTFVPPDKKFAIIIQGNIGEYFPFLLESVNIYKKIFPNTLIIVSTWEDEDNSKINELKKFVHHVVINKKPKEPAYGNINFQIISTYAGLKIAEANGVEFCLKTRADCRMHKTDILPFLEGLIDQFPIHNKNVCNSRIIASSVNTCKYKVYGITDILLFGRTIDLLIYFDKTLFDKSLEQFGFGKFPSTINSTPVVAETFLCARYLKSIGIDLEWSLEHWWDCLRDYFCVVDSDSLDFFWYKSDWKYEKRFVRNYTHKSSRAVNFSDWFALLCNQNLKWKNINYMEKWEINENQEEDEDLFIKKSIF